MTNVKCNFLQWVADLKLTEYCLFTNHYPHIHIFEMSRKYSKNSELLILLQTNTCLFKEKMDTKKKIPVSFHYFFLQPLASSSPAVYTSAFHSFLSFSPFHFVSMHAILANIRNPSATWKLFPLDQYLPRSKQCCFCCHYTDKKQTLQSLVNCPALIFLNVDLAALHNISFSRRMSNNNRHRLTSPTAELHLSLNRYLA